MSGELPRGWVNATIGDVIVPKIAQKRPSSGEQICYIDISSIDNHSKTVVDPKLLVGEKAPSRARQIAQPGDILVSMTRPNLNAVAILDDTLTNPIASTGFAVLRPFAVEPKFLFDTVRSSSFVNQMSALVQGALYPAVRPSDIRDYSFSLPPMNEQKRIVAKIESLQARTKRARQALESIPPLIEKFRQSVLAAAFRGDLTKEWREKNKDKIEPASELLKRIRIERRKKWEEEQLKKFEAAGKMPKDGKWKEKYKEPVGVDAEGLPELPEGWCWTALELLAPAGAQNGLYVPKTLYGKGTPIIRIDDYQADWCRSYEQLQCVDIDPSTSAIYSLQPEDLIINRVNSPTHLGKCLVVPQASTPAVFESNMMRLSVVPEMSSRLLALYLNSYDGKKRLIKDAKWAVNQASINQGNVLSTRVPLPPFGEQHAVLERLQVVTGWARRALSSCEEQVERLQVLDQSILAKAFRGELVSQDPYDEPASALLERIKVGREQHREAKTAKARGANFENYTTIRKPKEEIGNSAGVEEREGGRITVER